MGFTYSDLAVQVLRDEDQGVYKFGVVLDGTFVPFASRKLGGVDDQIAAAKAVAAQQAETTAPAPGPSEPPTLAPSTG